VVVSGEERIVKPDWRIFQLLLDRFGLAPAVTLFIDDSAANVAAARELGLDAVQFHGPDQLRQDLTARGLLDAAPGGSSG
jgi:2-haloacid dehalogenase